MTYIVLDPERRKGLSSSEFCRKRPLRGTSGCIVVSHTVNLANIPENSKIHARGRIWEIHLPLDFSEKNKEKVAKTLDAIAFF